MFFNQTVISAEHVSTVLMNKMILYLIKCDLNDRDFRNKSNKIID